MATRPSEKPAWVPSNDPAKIVAPSASKKNTGWLQEEKPPFQYFNWFWNLLDGWLDYFGGFVDYNVVIDSVVAEADFTTLAAYLAAAPAAGDRVLLKIDETITATLSIPAGVLVHQIKGKSITTTTVITPIIELSNGAVLEGDFKVNSSHAGTIANALSFNGDGCRVDNFILENTTAGIVTNAIQIEAGKVNNTGQAQVNNTGAGSITKDLNNVSASITNNVVVRTDTGVVSSDTLSTSKIQTVDASVAGNALTITLKPTTFDFRSNPLTSGNINSRIINTDLSLVISSGSTLGLVNAVQSRIAVLAIDNAGTIELAAVNLAGGNNLDETTLISTTAEGGAGAADAPNVIYSNTARVNVPFRVVGYVESTQAVAGAWATAPSTIQGYGGQALAAMSSFGFGQTWQDVSGSRVLSTTYYNTTGKPISISVGAHSTLVATINVTINGVTVGIGTVSVSGITGVGTIIIPPNASYSVALSAGTPTLISWDELR